MDDKNRQEKSGVEDLADALAGAFLWFIIGGAIGLILLLLIAACG